MAVVEEVQRRVDAEIRPQLPPGVDLEFASNDAELIYEIIDALKAHLLEGTILAGLVVWFFLRSFRSTLIIATAIPVSLLGAVALMYFLGFTFNSLTMLALLLLIGVVVDDAIVVLENIYRHREHHRPGPGLGGHQRHRPGAVRGARGQPDAGVHLRRGDLPRRHHRAFLPVVRGGGHGRRARLAVGVADADADAVLALPRRQALARARAHGADSASATAWTAATGACSAFAPDTAGRWCSA
jgi:hypothetical protein